MTPMQAKAAERERLALLDIHPVALMCRSEHVIAEITSEDMLKIINLTGQYDDTDKLLAGDRRYHMAKVA